MRSKPQPKSGPKPTQLDWNSFDKLCAMQATLEEISSFFDCSEDTVERCVKRDKGMGFKEYWTIKSSKGKISLRRKQFEVAMSGDKTLLIWLGKQWLGQTEKQDITERSVEMSYEDYINSLNKEKP